jgi:hypothetical protein
LALVVHCRSAEIIASCTVGCKNSMVWQCMSFFQPFIKATNEGKKCAVHKYMFSDAYTVTRIALSEVILCNLSGMPYWYVDRDNKLHW